MKNDLRKGTVFSIPVYLATDSDPGKETCLYFTKPVLSSSGVFEPGEVYTFLNIADNEYVKPGTYGKFLMELSYIDRSDIYLALDELGRLCVYYVDGYTDTDCLDTQVIPEKLEKFKFIPGKRYYVTFKEIPE